MKILCYYQRHRLCVEPDGRFTVYCEDGSLAYGPTHYEYAEAFLLSLCPA